MAGFLVTFEGGDGCGKSTQIKLFTEFLKKNKYDFICTREPGGTDVGEEIREILLHSKGKMSAETEFLLFSASRSKIVEDVIRPALQEGKVVVLDRYFDSSYTYQGYAGNLKVKDLKNITEFAIKGTVPDLTFLLDLSYDDAMKRKSGDEKLKNLDRIESKGKKYHDKVRRGYLKLAQKNKDRIVVIDANQSIEKIEKQIKEEFLRRYNKKD